MTEKKMDCGYDLSVSGPNDDGRWYFQVLIHDVRGEATKSKLYPSPNDYATEEEARRAGKAFTHGLLAALGATNPGELRKSKG